MQSVRLPTFHSNHLCVLASSYTSPLLVLLLVQSWNATVRTHGTVLTVLVSVEPCCTIFVVHSSYLLAHTTPRPWPPRLVNGTVSKPNCLADSRWYSFDATQQISLDPLLFAMPTCNATPTAIVIQMVHAPCATFAQVGSMQIAPHGVRGGTTFWKSLN